MKIALLPTGRTEWHGLPGALRSLFPAEPAHEFYVVPTAAEIRSNPDGFPYPGFTTSTLRAAASNCTRYNESSDGGRALAGLDWAALMRRPADHLQSIRAFVADLEDALGQAPITGPVAGQQARDTSRFTRRIRPVLRNL